MLAPRGSFVNHVRHFGKNLGTRPVICFLRFYPARIENAPDTIFLTQTFGSEKQQAIFAALLERREKKPQDQK